MIEPEGVLMTQENERGISIMYPYHYKAYKDNIINFGLKCADKYKCKAIKILINNGKMTVLLEYCQRRTSLMLIRTTTLRWKLIQKSNGL